MELSKKTTILLSPVLPIDAAATDAARALIDRHPELMARDALHAAVAIAGGHRLCTWDRDFDVIPELARLESR